MPNPTAVFLLRTILHLGCVLCIVISVSVFEFDCYTGIRMYVAPAGARFVTRCDQMYGECLNKKLLQ
jgi:hypothetical protein